MTTKQIVLKFESGLTSAQEQLLNALLAAVFKMGGKDGLLKNNRDAKKTIKETSDIINRVLEQSGFEGLVKELITDFDQIDANILAQQKEFNGLDVPATVFSPQKQLFIDGLTDSLIAGGIRSEFENPIKQIIFSYVRRQEPVIELEKVIRNSVAVDLKRWAGTTARDAVYGYQGAANEAIKEEYGMDGFVYVGSERLNTRSQCSKWMRAGKQPDEFWEGEIAWAKRGGTYDKKRVSGFKKDTRLSNFAQNRGGYGCLHEAVPVFL